MRKTKILILAGSIRSGASSGKLAAVAAKEIALADAEVTQISLADYPLPIVDGDMLADSGVPDEARALARMIAAHDGAFLATPEYNHSLPPLLKNALDWMSRLTAADRIPFRGRVWAMASSSNSAVGGARALVELRTVLAGAVGALVIPEQVSLGGAARAFDEAGKLTDETAMKGLVAQCARLVDLSRRLGEADRA